MTALIALLSFGDFWWSLANLVFIASLWAKVCVLTWCQVIRILTQFSAFSTVISTCCMATLGLLSLYHPDASQHRYTALFFVAIIFLLPTAQNAFLALEDEPDKWADSGWCLPKRAFHNYGWFLPIGLCLAYIVLSFTLLLVNYYCFFSKEKTDATGRPNAFTFLIKKVLTRILVFLFVWGIDLGAFLFLHDKMFEDHSSFMWYLVEISVNSSGLLHFLIYGLDNKDFRKHYSFSHGLLIFCIAPFYLIGVTCHYVYRRIRNEGCTCSRDHGTRFIDHSDCIERDVLVSSPSSVNLSGQSTNSSFLHANHTPHGSGRDSPSRPFLSMKAIERTQRERERRRHHGRERPRQTTTTDEESEAAHVRVAIAAPVLIAYDAANRGDEVETVMSTSIND